MIKKSLILAALFAFTLTGAIAADTAATVPAKKITEQAQTALPERPDVKPSRPEFDAPPPPPCPKAKADFEKRLKLTDEQKELAKQLRMKGHEEMKPIMEKMRELRLEKEAVLKSRMAEAMQQEKIAEINAKIKDLRKHAHELRIKNMKEFEAILTDKQKKELKKMKEEGRKNFEKAKKKCKKECKCPCPMTPPQPQPADK